MSFRIFGSADHRVHQVPVIKAIAAADMSVTKGELLELNISGANIGKVKNVGNAPIRDLHCLTIRTQDLKANDEFEVYEITPTVYLAIVHASALNAGSLAQILTNGKSLTGPGNHNNAVVMRKSKAGEEAVIRVLANALALWRTGTIPASGTAAQQLGKADAKDYNINWESA